MLKLRELPKNQRVSIILEPFSSVLAGIHLFYAALYMQANGLSAKQIGLIATIGAGVGIFLLFLAAPITHALGRRRTMTLFSIICWSLPLLLWAMADRFLLFLFAAMFFSFSKIATVACYCILTEDIDNDKKARVFGILGTFASLGGVVSIFMGPMIEKYGIVSSGRCFYAFAFVCMTVMFIVRHTLVTETQPGAALNHIYGELTISQSFRRHWKVVGLSLKNLQFLRIVIVFALYNIAFNMTFVQTLFYRNVVKLTMFQLSVIPTVGAVVTLLLLRYVVKHLDERKEQRRLWSSLMIFAAGALMILWIPVGGLWQVLFASALIFIGRYLFQVSGSVALNNRMGDLHKADMWSAIQLLNSLAIIPAGYIAGWAFEVNPRLPILIIGLILAAGAVLMFVPMKIR